MLCQSPVLQEFDLSSLKVAKLLQHFLVCAIKLPPNPPPQTLVTGGAILGPTARLEILDRPVHGNNCLVSPSWPVVSRLPRLAGLKVVREAYGMKETGLLTYTYPKYAASMTGHVKSRLSHHLPVFLPWI